MSPEQYDMVNDNKTNVLKFFEWEVKQRKCQAG